MTATKRDKLQVLRRIDLPLKKVLRNAPHLSAIYKARRDLRDVLG